MEHPCGERRERCNQIVLDALISNFIRADITHYLARLVPTASRPTSGSPCRRTSPSSSSRRSPPSSSCPASTPRVFSQAGPRVAAPGDEPVIDAPRGVPLLPRGAGIGLEGLLDPPPVAPEGRPGPPGGKRRGGRHALHVGALRHGVPTQVRRVGRLGPRAPGGLHRPYIVHCVQGHGRLPRPSRAGSPKSPPGKTIRRGPRPRSPGRSPSD